MGIFKTFAGDYTEQSYLKPQIYTFDLLPSLRIHQKSTNNIRQLRAINCYSRIKNISDEYTQFKNLVITGIFDYHTTQGLKVF